MEEADKGRLMIRIGEWVNVFLVPAHPGSPRQRDIKSWSGSSSYWVGLHTGTQR